MSESYQRVIAVAAGTEAIASLRAALDNLPAYAGNGALAVGELRSNPLEAAPTPYLEPERLQRNMALGGVASRWRHTLNNSLAALLAEAQLMGMEPLSAEHAQAVERMVSLCRRMIGILRDGPPPDPYDEPAE
jgi:signal transduction histidine kinase